MTREHKRATVVAVLCMDLMACVPLPEGLLTRTATIVMPTVPASAATATPTPTGRPIPTGTPTHTATRLRGEATEPTVPRRPEMCDGADTVVLLLAPGLEGRTQLAVGRFSRVPLRDRCRVRGSYAQAVAMSDPLSPESDAVLAG